jgi:hypothetical protein
VACQHLATYFPLTRGFRIEHVAYHGYQPYVDHSGLPIFGGGRAARGYLAYDIPYLDEERRRHGGDWGKYTATEANPFHIAPGALYVTYNHTCCIVRVNAARTRFQCFETHTPTDRFKQYVFEQPAAAQASGGYTAVSHYGGRGCGLIPTWSPEPLDEMAGHLRTARCVGLMRLVVAVRRPLGGATDQKVVYVSPLVLTYGSESGRAMSMARMLWAIRGTPGYDTLQPYLLLYTPKGLLAKAMWAPDGREMSLAQYVGTHQPGGIHDGRDIEFLAGATNHSADGSDVSRHGSGCCRMLRAGIRSQHRDMPLGIIAAASTGKVPWNEEWAQLQGSEVAGSAGRGAVASNTSIFRRQG